MQKSDGNGYYSQGHLDWFAKHGKEAPYHAAHGQVDDISQNLVRVKTSNWCMTAPGILECDTNMGVLRQSIPNDMVCHGTDDNGMPILAKVVMQ
jgi:hypothetical protein